MSDDILNEHKVKKMIEDTHGPNLPIIIGDSASETLNKQLLEQAENFDVNEHGDFKRYIADVKDKELPVCVGKAIDQHSVNFEELFVRFDSEEAEEIFHGMVRDMVEDNDKTYEGLGI